MLYRLLQKIIAYLGLRLMHDDERGDVPGWVLITVMTAGIVAGLWRFAGAELQSMLENALSSVSG